MNIIGQQARLSVSSRGGEPMITNLLLDEHHLSDGLRRKVMMSGFSSAKKAYERELKRLYSSVPAEIINISDCAERRKALAELESTDSGVQAAKARFHDACMLLDALCGAGGQ